MFKYVVVIIILIHFWLGSLYLIPKKDWVSHVFAT